MMTAAHAPEVRRLACPTKEYDWGALGKDGKRVAQYAATTEGTRVDPETPYAELWMGSHPSGPSLVFPNRALLSTILNRQTLGEKIHDAYGDVLPFLFKVLSVRKALSVQAHPDKALAKKLHAEKPDIYKDANHKPEMVIALTDFEALCGFRPESEIVTHLSEYPEFRAVAGASIAAAFERAGAQFACRDEIKAALKSLFRSVMKADAGSVRLHVNSLADRLRQVDEKSRSPLDSLIVRLSGQFPGDVGIFCALMFNYVLLKPGQAMFLSANEPHAYLFGDCVECMAASDNVVRAGLTPKFKDVDVLVDMLTYQSGPPSKRIMKPTPLTSGSAKHTVVYDPPIDEFTVMQTILPSSGSSAGSAGAIAEVVPPLDGASILIVTEGAMRMTASDPASGRDVSSWDVYAGHVYFVPAGVGIRMEVIPSPKADTSVVVYRAYSEV